MELLKKLSIASLFSVGLFPLASYAADPATPLTMAQAGQIPVFQSCLDQATGANGAAAVDSQSGNLANYKNCLSDHGYSFDGNNSWWVSTINDYCAKDGTVVFGLENDYNSYKACLSNRGVDPSLYTVSSKYIKKVNEYCWGDESTLERVLSVLTIWGIDAATPSEIGNLQDFANALGWTIKTAETGFDVKAYFDYLQKPLPDLVNDMLPPNIYSIPPKAISNYTGYEQCLKDRSVKGLDFKPMHTVNKEQAKVWAGMVNSYCYSQIVLNQFNVGWSAATYKQCLRDRKYPENGLTDSSWLTQVRSVDVVVQWTGHVNCDSKYHMSTDPTSYLSCLKTIGVAPVSNFLDDIAKAVRTQCNSKYPDASQGQNATQYRACFTNNSVAFTSADEAALYPKIKSYCDNSYYTGGRFADYNAYFQCFRERGVSFSNDAGWQSGVRSYCSNSNMVINKLGGYKTCLSQRQVPYVESYWRSDVKTYCDNSSYAGGRFNNYGPYFQCFTERGTTFVNDYTWQQGVRDYCGSSNVQYNKLPGYQKCLSERQVSYDSGAWCPVVKKYCDAQWYPFGGKDKCFSERGCTMY